MASFAAEAVSCISHLMPAERELERYFAEDPSVEEEGEEEESFDFTVPLEQEHLEALARYQEMIQDEAKHPDDVPTGVYDFLQGVAEQSYPFGFWYECCLSSIERDFSLAYIILMMSDQAASPLESIHALYSAALEMVNGVLEFDAESFQALSTAVGISKERLVRYVPRSCWMMVEALWDNYLETIDRGEEQMDRQLIAIETVYLKLISKH